MKKRITALLMSVVMVFSLCSNGLGLLDWSTADAASSGYTAYLQFCDTDYSSYAFAYNYPTASAAVTGLGDYTISWDVTNVNYAADSAAGISYMYLEIPNAYADFTENGWTIGNVSVIVDGTKEYEINEDYLWTYANIGVENSSDNYVAELYNLSGYSGAGYGSAIDAASFYAASNITVKFSVVEVQPDLDFNVWLQFMGNTVDNSGNSTPIGNYHVDTVSDSHIGTVQTSDLDDGEATYTLSWNIGDMGYLAAVNADGTPAGTHSKDPQTGVFIETDWANGEYGYYRNYDLTALYPEYYPVTELTKLYIEIDDAYQTFVDRGYMIEDVAVRVRTYDSANGYSDTKEIPVNQDYLWTYPSAVSGEENDFIIELHNEDGNSGYYGTSAIDISEFVNVDYVEVEFTVKRITGNVYLQYANEATVYDAEDGAADYSYNGQPAVANYHRLTEGSPVTFNGLGIYTLYWNVGDWGTLYDAATNAWYESDQSTYYSVDNVGWLYVEIDEVYDLFTEYGYVVENVVLYLDNTAVPLNQEYVWNYASLVDSEENDYIIELYNLNGYSGFYGQSAIASNAFGDGTGEVFGREGMDGSVDKIAISFLVTEGDSIGGTDMSVHTGKWVSAGEDTTDMNYDLLLEGWVNGVTQEITNPSDVVLVLDQSASMYTPMGLKTYLWNWSLFDGEEPGLERYTTQQVKDMLGVNAVDADTQLTISDSLSQLGYFIAQSTTGSADYCNIEEHTHTDGDCSLCWLAEHTHSAECRYALSCSNNVNGNDRVASYYNWTGGTPYSKWITTGVTGLHLKLRDEGNGILRVVDIAEGVTPAGSGWADDSGAYYYVTVSNYNEQHPAAALNVGDCIELSSNADLDATASADNANTYMSIEPTSSQAKCRYVLWSNTDKEYTYYGGIHQMSGPNNEYLWGSYENTDTRLTDGKLGVYDSDAAWGDETQNIMWSSSDGTNGFDLTLAVDFDNYIYADTFTIHGACGAAGISEPSELKIMYHDGTRWITLDSVNYAYVDGYSYTMTVKLDGPVYTNTIGFRIYSDGLFIAVDEVSVSLTNRVNVLSANASYTTSGTLYDYWSDPTDRFHDDGSRLTDGVKGTTDAYNAAYSAWRGNAEIVVDLGYEAMQDVYRMYAVSASGGINHPDNFTVYVSNDKATWTEVAATTEAAPIYSYNGTTTYIMTAYADEIQFARYVKFVTGGGANFTWIDEVEVGMSAAGASFLVNYMNEHGNTHYCDNDCYLCDKVTHSHEVTCGFGCPYTTHIHVDCELKCTESHTHVDGCYGCGQMYHIHNGSVCGLLCGQVEHTHGDASVCGAATCGSEQHIHFIDCVGAEEYGCTETVHIHSATCYTNCSVGYEHTHAGSCGLGCKETEHIHSSTSEGITSKSDTSYCWTYDWYICQYLAADHTENTTGEAAIRMYQVTYTSTPARDDTSRFFGQSKGSLFYEGNLDQNWEDVPVSRLGSHGYDFNFYKTQYGALYDSLNDFVLALDASGLQHRISVVGFSSEWNTTGADYFDGTGFYVGTTYYNFMDPATMPFGSAYQVAGTLGLLDSYTAADGTVYTSAANGTWNVYVAIQTDAENGVEAAKSINEQVYVYMRGEVLKQDKNAANYASAFMTMNADADDTGMASILASINAIETDFYYTNHYLGMYQAKQILEAYKDNYLDGDDVDENGTYDRQKVVVLFTDGIAQMQCDGGDGYQDYTNDWTIKYAREMEATYGAKVYSICTSTVKSTGDFSADYLHYAASDFADDESTSDVDEGVYSVETGNDNRPLTDATIAALEYFNRVESANELSEAFLSITTQFGGTTSSLDVTASLQDIMTTDFVLDQAMWAALQTAYQTANNTAGFETVFYSNDATYADIINQYIKVYTVKAEDGTASGTYTFPENTTGLPFLDISTDDYQAKGIEDITSNVLIEVGLRADGRYYVRIDGFDYSKNFVSVEGRDTNDDDVADFWGKKLVTVIPIEAASDAVGGERLKTNYDSNNVGGFSGILAYAVDDSGNITNIYQSGDFEEPKVDLPTAVTVSKVVAGGSADESFGFKISYTKFTGYDETVYDSSDTGNVLGGNWLKAEGAVTAIGDTQAGQTPWELGDGESRSVEDVVVGTGITITELDFSEYDVTVLVYDKDGNPVTEGVTVDAVNGTVTIASVTEGMKIEFTNTIRRVDLTITKTVANYNAAYDQSFVFRVQGVSSDANTKDINITVVLKVGEDGQGSVTIKDLPKGSYVIAEDGGWSWRYDLTGVTTVDSSGTETNPNAASLDVTPFVSLALDQNYTVNYTNGLSDKKWMDDETAVQNLFIVQTLVDGTGSSNEDESEDGTEE